MYLNLIITSNGSKFLSDIWNPKIRNRSRKTLKKLWNIVKANLVRLARRKLYSIEFISVIYLYIYEKIESILYLIYPYKAI
jgi:hypothetical protein